MKRILIDGGYIEGNTYYFYLTDHLGNNRVVIDQSGQVIQKNDYYPFGMVFAEGTVAEQGKQPYKFGNKELDQMHGLNQYDIEARYYDPPTGRFTTIDPMAEKYYSISPYVYCANNPLRFIDPTGMYFDYKNEKRAQKLEKKIDKRMDKLIDKIYKLSKKGEDVGDLYQQLSELQQSKGDISSMRDNTETEFVYAKASDKNNPAGKGNPVISKTGVNDKGHDIVTMFSDGVGSQVHETRHGGQIARGAYSFDQQGNPTSGYNLKSEVSAYQAQYAYDGKLIYIDASNPTNQNIVSSTGLVPIRSTVMDINSITTDFVGTKIGEVKPVTIRNKIVYGLVPLYQNLR